MKTKWEWKGEVGGHTKGKSPAQGTHTEQKWSYGSKRWPGKTGHSLKNLKTGSANSIPISARNAGSSFQTYSEHLQSIGQTHSLGDSKRGLQDWTPTQHKLIFLQFYNLGAEDQRRPISPQTPFPSEWMPAFCLGSHRDFPLCICDFASSFNGLSSMWDWEYQCILILT